MSTTRPGAWVAAQATRRERIIWTCLAGFAVICVAMLVLAIDGRLSIAASIIFVLAVLAARPYAERYLSNHLRWERGARAETAVGETLNRLRDEGWTVIHDIKPSGRANVDHVVCGRGGVFVVETKDRRYEDRDLVRTKRQAAQLHDRLGVWVMPVICLHRREANPFRTQGVWIVPRQHLLAWLRDRNERPAPEERLAAWLQSLERR